MGGLGNQMFQYALAKNIAIRNKTNLVFDLTFLNLRQAKANYVYRNYDLDVFNIEENSTFLSRNPKVFQNSTYLFQTLINKLNKKINKKNFIEELKPYEYDFEVLNSPNGSYLVGYWQNEKYFYDIKEIIKDEFSSFRYPLSEKAEELSRVINGENSICLNFRRTDYITSQEAKKFHGSIENDFYDLALEIIRKKINDPRLFVFSDDIDWCKNNFKSSLPTTFVDGVYVGKKYSDYFRLMRACKHYVIPNSTFAWWAAWLNSSKDKIVIAPKRWVASEKINSDDFVPKNWIRV